MKTTTIQCNLDGVRLDVFLSSSLPNLTRSAAVKLLDSGYVSLAGTAETASLKKNHKTSAREIYIVKQEEPESSAAAAQNIRLDIVYEDADIIVINKPRGMVVHPAPGHPDGTLVNALLYHCGSSLSGIGGVLRPGIVHRIDKDTSGLVAAAKNDRAHLSLSSQLSSRTLKREYAAVVCGNMNSSSGTIDVPIGRHPADRKKQLAGPGQKRSAVTHYEVIARYNGYTYISCRLETGRTHQIRVHMSYAGHPVLGDKLYGRKQKQSYLNMDGQCLHARKICFSHPSSGKQIELSAPLPDYFTEVLGKLENL